MAIDFSLEPEFQQQLEWIDDFVRREVEPLDALFPEVDMTYDKANELCQGLVRPLQQQVKERGLWAMHLPASLGGMGIDNVHLAYVNEILGRTVWGAGVFGCQAPDAGNAEILAHCGAAEQRAE